MKESLIKRTFEFFGLARAKYDDEAHTPDKPTLHLQMLDDHPRVVALHDAIKNKAPLPVIRELLTLAIADLWQTYHKCVEERAHERT